MTQQEYENKIKELENQIEELKMAKIEEPQSRRWKPQIGDDYFYVSSYSEIIENGWDNDNVGNWLFLTGNCFKTKEEAEEHRKKIEYTARYKNYIEEHSEPLDWNNSRVKYFLGYDP